MAKKQAEDLDLELEGLEDLDFGDLDLDDLDEEVEDLSVDEEEEEKPQTPEPKEAEAPAPKRRGRKPKGAKEPKGAEEPKAEEPAPKTEAKAESTATTAVVLADQRQVVATSAEVPAPLLVEAINHRIRVLRERDQDTSQLEWVLSLLSVLQV